MLLIQNIHFKFKFDILYQNIFKIHIMFEQKLFKNEKNMLISLFLTVNDICSNSDTRQNMHFLNYD